MIIQENISISIIIPMYNVSNCIEKCLESIVCQTFKEFEVVLIDDASTDDCLMKAENYLTKNHIPFQSIIQNQNKKQGTARNQGLRIAQGKYILFVDADDSLSGERVLEEYMKIMSTDSYDFIETNFYTFSESEGRKKQEFTNERTIFGKIEQEDILNLLLENTFPIAPWSKLITKEFLETEQINFPEGIYFEDNLWSLNLYRKASKIFYSPEYTYLYNISNPISTTKTINTEKLDDLFYAISSMFELIDQESLCTDKRADLLRQFVFRVVDGLFYRAAMYKDKDLWLTYFKKLKSVFQTSALSHYKSFMFVRPVLLYRMYKERIRIDGLKKNTIWRIYDGLFRILFLYAFAGGKTTIQKIGQRIT